MSQTELPKNIAHLVSLAILRCERFKITTQIEELSKAIHLLESAIRDSVSYGLASSAQFSTLFDLNERIFLVEEKMSKLKIGDETLTLYQEDLNELFDEREMRALQVGDMI